MAVADDALISEAAAALGCVDLGAIGTPGGQKAVRRVTHNGADRVMKVVAIDYATPDAVKRAEREVSLLAELSSPNVVRVESSLEELGSPAHGAAWLEELLDGDDLSVLVGNAPWTWDATRDMARQIANGLAAAHDKQVVHRDLSANNVRRLSDGTYRVLDFGFARHTLRSGLTVAGQPGTPGYFTPEHLRSYSGGPMPASDVFQVGQLMYLALTTELPFPWSGDEYEYAGRLGRGQYEDIATRRTDLTLAQRALVRRALHPQPARRYLNAAMLRDALDGLA